jgi:hypothetical protein
MGLNFSALVYAPNFDMFARPITVYPFASQSGAPSFGARGIFHSDRIETALEDGSIFIDQQTSIDILEVEFPIIPQQGDRVVIPADGAVPAVGEFEVLAAYSNAGGETNLTLRAWLPAVP